MHKELGVIDYARIGCDDSPYHVSLYMTITITNGGFAHYMDISDPKTKELFEKTGASTVEKLVGKPVMCESDGSICHFLGAK